MGQKVCPLNMPVWGRKGTSSSKKEPKIYNSTSKSDSCLFEEKHLLPTYQVGNEWLCSNQAAKIVLASLCKKTYDECTSRD